ncbi:MAG: hypothetical protein QOG15_1529 [Solirubrobacteraceae bacterium]|jgi:hypothetical protein|nr:hypothetical protein [Solirubrobacteraceae bacterium]
MGDESSLPMRWETAAARPDLPVPVPPADMPLVRGGRPLKRWRYIAAFSDELMLCAGSAQIGPLRSSWWAIWDRSRGELSERTRVGRGTAARFGPGGRLTVRDRRASIDLDVEEGSAVESLNPHGEQYVWTRKQSARPAGGRITVGGRTVDFAGLAVVDDTAGYHARATEWWWSAGVGHAADGAAVGWNLVSGVNDGPRASERSIWSAAGSREVGPARFARDLTAVAFAEGGELRFSEESVRARTDGLFLVVRSDYRQPFGSFEGSLPGVGRVSGGLGVMEHHIARW